MSHFQILPWLLSAGWLGSAVMEVRAQSSLVQAKTTYFFDDPSHTESVRDPIKRELTESTYDSRNMLMTKTVFRLNDSGSPTQGLIFDSSDNLVAKVQFYFDDLGRTIEERMFNLQGQVFERIIQTYDSQGRALKPTVYKATTGAPKMKTPSIDFTKPSGKGSNAARVSPPTTASYSTGAPPQQGAPRAQVVTPQNVEPLRILTVSPQTGNATVEPSGKVR